MVPSTKVAVTVADLVSSKRQGGGTEVRIWVCGAIDLKAAAVTVAEPVE